MVMSRNWFRSIVRRKLIKPSQSRSKATVHVLHTNSITSNTNLLDEQQIVDHVKEDNTAGTIVVSSEALSNDDITAAIKIQSSFRRHLARRAYRALRSLVKLQALVRGACVRKQSHIAIHCMHALVRLQVRVQARQLLIQCTDETD